MARPGKAKHGKALNAFKARMSFSHAALAILAMGMALTPVSFATTARAQEVVATHYPNFVLPYRSSNRWVHQEDKKQLDALTRYAKRENIYSFDIILPENSDNNMYIERLLVLSRIMKSRLKRETIVFRQELGATPPNTITVTPSDSGTTTK